MSKTYSDEHDTGLKFELNNEIESLTRDIAEQKKKILALNDNLSNEIDTIDSSKIH